MFKVGDRIRVRDDHWLEDWRGKDGRIVHVAGAGSLYAGIYPIDIVFDHRSSETWIPVKPSEIELIEAKSE